MKIITNKNNYIIVNKECNLSYMQLHNFLSRRDGASISIVDFDTIKNSNCTNIFAAMINDVYYSNFPLLNSESSLDTFNYTKSYTEHSIRTCRKVFFEMSEDVGIYKSTVLSDLPFDVTFANVPVQLCRKCDVKYFVKDVCIVDGGSNYKVGDTIYAQFMPVIVTSITDWGGILTISRLGDEYTSESHSEDLSGNYKVTGGSGSGAILKVRTVYELGETPDTGTLYNTSNTDALIQESYLRYIVKNITVAEDRYTNGRLFSKSCINNIRNKIQIEYHEYEDSEDPAEVSSSALTVENDGVYFTSNDNRYKLQTENDLMLKIVDLHSHPYLGVYTYFANKQEIIEHDARINTTAITADTFELGLFDGTTWQWSELPLVGGMYMEIDVMLQYPGTKEYRSGLIKFVNVDGNNRWVVRPRSNGDIDGKTLQENDDGTIGLKLNSDDTLSFVDSTRIRVKSHNAKTLYDEIVDITGELESVSSFVQNKVMTKPEIQYGNLLTIEDGVLVDSYIVKDNVVTKSDEQIITGNKTFAGTVKFDDIVEMYDVTVSGGIPYTTENKPTPEDIGAISKIQFGNNVFEENIVNIDKDILLDVLNLGDIIESNIDEFATKEQGLLADSAYQKPNTGIPYDDLSEVVQSALRKAENAYTELPIASSSIKGVVTLGSVFGAARYGKKEDVGLDKVPNVNSQNASNITTGELNIKLLSRNLIMSNDDVIATRQNDGSYDIRITKTMPYEIDIGGTSPGNWTKIASGYRYVITESTHKKGRRPDVSFYNSKGDKLYLNYNVNFETGDVTCFNDIDDIIKIIIK